MARKAVSAAAPKGEVQEFVVGQLEEARKRLVVFERELVKRGRAQQREVETLLKNVRQGKPLRALEKQASAATAEVKKRLDGLQDQVLGALGVASRAELLRVQINKELSKLSKKVDTLVSRKSSASTVV